MGSWEQIQSGKIEVVTTFQCKGQLSKNNYCLNSLLHPFILLHKDAVLVYVCVDIHLYTHIYMYVCMYILIVLGEVWYFDFLKF